MLVKDLIEKQKYPTHISIEKNIRYGVWSEFVYGLSEAQRNNAIEEHGDKEVYKYYYEYIEDATEPNHTDDKLWLIVELEEINLTQ